jgi:hypothetical protein
MPEAIKGLGICTSQAFWLFLGLSQADHHSLRGMGLLDGYSLRLDILPGGL